MVKYALALFLILIVYILQNPRAANPKNLPALYPELRATHAHPAPDTDSLAFAAIDRQCGSCHHGGRSTNTGALAIFNLKDTCWYCTLTPGQCTSLKGRISGSTFSDAERSAILAVIAQLADDDRAAH